MQRKKIVLIGSGQIGSTIALLCANKELGDILLYDLLNDMPLGKSLDLSHMCAIEGLDVNILGTGEIKKISGADVVIITAGIPRKPGMTREDLLAVNKKIMEEVGSAVKQYCPLAFCIVITNPLDVMVGVFRNASGLNHNQVVGMAGILDGARFKYLLAKKMNVSFNDVQTLVLGGHGDTMVPLPRFTTVSGISVPELIKMGKITQSDMEEICNKVRNGGAEIVSLLKTGSAYYAPASAAVAMAESYLKDQKRLLPCAVYLNGQYGVSGIYMGVPCVIGAGGIEKIIELQLNEEERMLLNRSILEVKKLNEASMNMSVEDKAKPLGNQEDRTSQIKSVNTIN